MESSNSDSESDIVDIDTSNVEDLMAVLTTDEEPKSVKIAEVAKPQTLDIAAIVAECNNRVSKHMEDDTPTRAYTGMDEAAFNVLYRSQLRDLIGFTQDSRISVIPEYMTDNVTRKRVDIAIIDDAVPKQKDGVLAIIELKYLRMGYLKYTSPTMKRPLMWTPALKDPSRMLTYLASMNWYIQDTESLTGLRDSDWSVRIPGSDKDLRDVSRGENYMPLSNVLDAAILQVRGYGKLIKQHSATKTTPLMFAAIGVGMKTFLEPVVEQHP